MKYNKPGMKETVSHLGDRVHSNEIQQARDERESKSFRRSRSFK